MNNHDLIIYHHFGMNKKDEFKYFIRKKSIDIKEEIVSTGFIYFQYKTTSELDNFKLIPFKDAFIGNIYINKLNNEKKSSMD